VSPLYRLKCNCQTYWEVRKVHISHENNFEKLLTLYFFNIFYEFDKKMKPSKITIMLPIHNIFILIGICSQVNLCLSSRSN
jgi:hypothetical protein